MPVKIYLDQSDLQRLCKPLVGKEILFAIETLVRQDKLTFVLSFNHVDENWCRTNEKEALSLAEYIDKLPHMWLVNFLYIEGAEIARAARAFRKGKCVPGVVNAFSQHVVDTHFALDASVRRHYQGKPFEQCLGDLLKHRGIALSDRTNLESQLGEWVEDNRRIIEKTSNLQKATKELFTTRARKAVEQYMNTMTRLKFSSDFSSAFAEFLWNNPAWCPGWRLEFEVVHSYLRTSQKPEVGDFADFASVCALPYVDLFSCDKRTYEHIRQAQHRMQKTGKTPDYVSKAFKNLDDLVARAVELCEMGS